MEVNGMGKPRSLVRQARIAGLGVLAVGVLSLLGLFLGHLAASGQPTCTDNWVGTHTTDWNTANNWSTDHVPTAASYVCMAASPVTTTINIADGNTGNADGI